MNLLSMLCGCLAFALLVVHGQAQSGFISIDCGIPEGSDYTDEVRNISYTSDARYIDTGTNHNISSVYLRAAGSRRLYALRSFPKGIKNCYTIKLAQADQGNMYLIRAIFMYGNYDFKNEPPVFELYLDGNKWNTIKLNASDVFRTEIIHVPATAYIHVCLVNNGSGTPFISALELRPLDNSTYQTESGSSGSLKLFARVDVGSLTNEGVRYGFACIDS